MALLAKQKTNSSDTPLDQALQRFRAIDDLLQSKIDRRERLEIARSLTINAQDADEERTEWARRRAGDLVEMARRRPDKTNREILDLTEAIEDLRAEHSAARAELDHQRSVRTSQLAIATQPAQRKIANRIAAALSELSAAIAAADDLQREFAARAPLSSSVYLPSLVDELGFAQLGDHQSSASRWVQRMKAVGVLPR
jgi:hypothetical protein